MAERFEAKPKDVEAAYTLNRELAEREVRTVLQKFTDARAISVQPGGSVLRARWTREEALEAMWADILDEAPKPNARNK